MNQISKRLTYANVMSTLAVFLILGGGAAFAASKKINGNRIKAGTIKTGKFARESVRTGKIAEGAVTESRIGDGAVTTNKLGDAAVTEPKLADNATTTPKLADNAVTTPKIANEAVKSEKLAGDSVTNPKIAANAVTQGKLAPGSVGSPQLKTIATTVATSPSTADNGSEGVTANCPAGRIAIAGGFETGNTGGDAWEVKRLLRVGNGWRVFGKNISGGNSTITAFVYCLLP